MRVPEKRRREIPHSVLLRSGMTTFLKEAWIAVIRMENTSGWLRLLYVKKRILPLPKTKFSFDKARDGL
jgi:hypothetical protein